MNTEYYKLLDNFVSVAFANLCTLAKKDGVIKLSQIDLKNDKHWALLNITAGFCSVGNINAQLDLSRFQFWKLSQHLYSPYFKRVRKNSGITCDKFINDIEEPNKNLMTNPFQKLTDEYYKRKK